jgi:DNA-binding NarL/FixJ family response regulator
MALPGVYADAETMTEVGKREMRCVLVDDSEQVLEALESVLVEETIEIVGRARTGVEALRVLEALPTTAVVLDLRLPDMDGIEVARRAAEILRRKTAVILYTTWADAQQVRDSLDAGVRGVVVKDASPENLLQAIAETAAGRIYLDPRLSRTEGRS